MDNNEIIILPNPKNSESKEENSESKEENSESKEENSESKEENNFNNNFNSRLIFLNLLSGNIMQFNCCNKLTDITLFFFSIGGTGFGTIAWFTINSITAIGYIMSGIFSTIALISIRKMRLRAALQSSVNVLKEENNELKENNEELQENIDELEDNIDQLEGNIDSLENISINLKNDLIILKKSIGLFGENSDVILEKLKEVYENLKIENEKQESLNKNTIYLHILHIIKHFDTNCEFILNNNDLENAKNILLNAFPNLNFEELKKKMKNNKISAENIYESVQLNS